MTYPCYAVGLRLDGDDLELLRCYLTDREERVDREPVGYGVVGSGVVAVLEDLDGGVLSRHPLLARTTCVEGGPPRTRLTGSVPVHGSAARLRFVRGGDEAVGASSLVLDLTGPPPVVEIVDGPAAHDVVDDRLQLLVRAEPSGQDPVHLTVRVSRDGGRTFARAAALDGRRPDGLWDVEVALGAGAGSDECLLQVQARTGVVWRTARTPVFTVVGAPPELVITSPVDGHQVREGDLVVLAATVVDLSDGAEQAAGPAGEALSDSAVVWESDVEGHLGAGSPVVVTLRPGPHVVTARFRGLSAAVTITSSDQPAG